MFPLDDPRWQILNGGYRQPTDAPRLLEQMEEGADVWSQLWEELHHQGDVDLASYAAIPHIVRIAQSQTPLDTNAYALAVVALSHDQSKLGAVITHLDASVLDEYAETTFAWSDLYRA